LKQAGRVGNWIMVQNVHLMTDWMKVFERELEIVVESNVHPDFRCFISSEPPPLPDQEIIPESILQNSVKVSNEAPQDLKANMRRALAKFPQPYYDKAKSHKENEFKALLFGLCMFHSLILGRRKFGNIGWSRVYNFNDGDLTICGDVLHNYLSKYEKVPYKDLCYIYGEIMYGGHITDNLDRRTNNTYLERIIQPAIMEQMQLTQSVGFKSPLPQRTDRDKYVEIVETQLPPEAPQMFGLHPNAEIGYLTADGNALFEQILLIQGGSGKGGGSGVQSIIDEFTRKMKEETPQFSMFELKLRGGTDPFWIVCLQECERINLLIQTIMTSLVELDMGLKGQLNITDAMDELERSLNLGFVPGSWVAVAYPSLKSLQPWFTDMIRRYNQLKSWSDDKDMKTPDCLWISGLFNPMSFLTAIMQKTARQKTLALDKLILKYEILNHDRSEIKAPAEDGAYIDGFFLEGAKWEVGKGDQ
jgi:dynein heavy chain, axonemal